MSTTLCQVRRHLPDAESLFWSHVDVDGPVADRRPDLGPCWLWLAATTPDGYARVNWKGTHTHAHRIGWQLAWGEPIPKGLRLTHFACSRRSCVNPAHVRPLVAVETVLGTRNVAGWNARHDTCLRGHPFTSDNSITVPGGRACRACRREVERDRRRVRPSPSSDCH